MAPNQWFYAITLPSGSSLSDTFPVDLSVSNTNSTTPQSYTIKMNAVGSSTLTAGASVPTGFSLTDNGAVTTENVVVSTGTLPDGNYNLNIQIDSDPAGQLTTDHNTIHIQVVVGSSSTMDCFLTSSDFLFLTDCTGADVNGSSGGTFQIVSNAKGRVVATNPGQFYYNAIWLNTGATRSIQINLGQTNLSTMGANSVHAMTFDATGFTADLAGFDLVNGDGTPCGPTGPCTVTVPSGQYLWVTWHLQFGLIGAPITGMSATCPGNEAVAAQVTLKETDGTVIGTCGTIASGYLKQ
jgi:hypothetical protein